MPQRRRYPGLLPKPGRGAASQQRQRHTVRDDQARTHNERLERSEQSATAGPVPNPHAVAEQGDSVAARRQSGQHAVLPRKAPVIKGPQKGTVTGHRASSTREKKSNEP